MTGYFKKNELEKMDPLFVLALEAEAGAEFISHDVLITGVGKVQAAYELTRRIAKNRPGLIVNLGSAGSNLFNKGEVICCTRFIQRDMDASGLGFKKYEVPFAEIPVVLDNGLKLDGLPEGICGSGDSFETDHAATDYNVVEMEAYSLAYIARKENIPFLCLKYISDGANGDAANDWAAEVHKAAMAFKSILFAPVEGVQQDSMTQTP